MKREDSKPEPARPKITKKISYKNVSDSCLAQFQACENKEFWNMTTPKPAASEGDMGAFIPLHPQLQQEVEQPEPDDLLYNRIVSDTVLLRPKNLSVSVRNIMDQKPKSNSDAILALRQVRELLLEECVRPPPGAYARGGVQKSKMRMTIGDIVQDKFYDGKIVKKVPAGLIIDINAECLGLLRWRLVRGVPKKLQKVGGFLGNLLITKVDKEARQFSLKLQGIGFDHDTIEETYYKDIYGYVHCWSELPGAPPYSRLAPPKVEDEHVAKPPVPPRGHRIWRGKIGPRNLGGA